MTTVSAQRILDLWPTLTPEKQAELVQTAERMAAPQTPRKLKEREIAAIARSRADYAAGRVLDEKAYDGEMSTFMADLKAKATPTT